MRVHAFLVLLKNGDRFTRGEWGRAPKSAAREIKSCYGEKLVGLWHKDGEKLTAMV